MLISTTVFYKVLHTHIPQLFSLYCSLSSTLFHPPAGRNTYHPSVSDTFPELCVSTLFLLHVQFLAI